MKIKTKLFLVRCSHLPMILSLRLSFFMLREDLQMVLDRVAPSRVVAMRTEDRKQNETAQGQTHLVLVQHSGPCWLCMGLMGICQCCPREWSHSLPCVSLHAKIPTRDVAENMVKIRTANL